ncbi:hypothetical protein N9N67_10495 [Bacteriovoracaceae bacterium]|nr:hypothetical protein [Bacteriovoracaceae bacterium]
MEKLEVEQKKSIINQLVSELATENMDLYYTDSSTIATLVLEKIQSGNLKRTELELVGKLNTEDILVLMSFHSNCC